MTHITMTLFKLDSIRIASVSFIIIVLFVFLGCDQGPVKQEAPTNSESIVQKEEAQLKSTALEKLSRSLALAVSDRKVRKLLQEELTKRYTGAPEALYSKIKNHKIQGGPPFQQRLAQAYAALRQNSTGKPVEVQEALRDVKKYVAKIPRLHVAMPRQLDSWNADEYTPWVTYVPQGIEDTEIGMITAYDADGNPHQIDGQNGPGQPVLVLGINERTDQNGEVLPSFGSSPSASTNEEQCEDAIECGGGGGDGTSGPSYETSSRESGDLQYISEFRVIDDEEPWAKEPADIKVKINGSAVPDDIPPLGDFSLNETDDGADFNKRDKKLFRWYRGDYGDFLGFDWREVDSGTTYTFNVDIKYVKFRYKWQDGDDNLGKAPVNWGDPYTDSYNTGYVAWKIRWTD